LNGASGSDLPDEISGSSASRFRLPGYAGGFWRALFFEWSFWVGFREKWKFFVVSSWTQRGEIVVEMWCFDADQSTLKNTPTF
jgi:hypothetical protein